MSTFRTQDYPACRRRRQKEIIEVVKSLKPGKSPGPDRFPGIFYKQFRETLSPILGHLFNKMKLDSPFTKQAQEAYNTLIAKPEQDPTQCSSYRLISLINLDLKMYAKLLAARLQTVIPSLIGLDQVGFVPNREAWDNILKTGLLIEQAWRSNSLLYLLSLDAEKAFDRLDWKFMVATLEQVGLPGEFIQKIMALYIAPSARIKVNGTLSSPIKISNGTHQGCRPLSPYLYILAMEHVAVAL